MKVNIKLQEGAIMPSYAKNGDAGLDLTAIKRTFENDIVVYYTGVHLEIPDGFVGLVFPRSSVANTDLILTNCVGVIDSGYRGEIKFKFRNLGHVNYKVGERIGQIIIMPYPKIELNLVSELSKTERGEGGYGHTGK